jgi:hypothetical protein
MEEYIHFLGEKITGIYSHMNIQQRYQPYKRRSNKLIFLKSTADCPLMWVSLFDLIFSIFNGFYGLRFGTTSFVDFLRIGFNRLTVFHKRWITVTGFD